MTRLVISVVILAFIGSSFAQTTPSAGKKHSAQAKSQPAAGCKLVGTVKGTKLWAGDCIAPEQLRTAEPASEHLFQIKRLARSQPVKMNALR